MLSDHEDSQNRSDRGTDPTVMGEASFSSSSSPSARGQEVINQGPSASTSGRGENPEPKTKAGGGKTGSAVPEMKGSLGQKDVLTVQRLDEELKHSATEASMVFSKIREEDLVDIRLS
ncbi:hypothetical protein Adt_17665 [Abeliophyllum distichum]|uniref:Uncharacterized protein n=1 Tax=Abeliophyllum distichum TaxID=126358 RepID=A0ABD1TH83_9LAMI